MIAAQIGSVVYAVKNNLNVEDEIRKGIDSTIAEINRNYETAFALETIQQDLKCCGWKGAIDYHNVTVPGSCCGIAPIHHDAPNPTCTTSDPRLYKDGCEHKLYLDQLSLLFKSSIGVGVVVVLFEFILIFAACCVARDIRH